MRGAAWAGLAAALALGGCLTDGPNRTGAAYLKGHDLLLETPLLKVEIKDFPVDTLHTTDADGGQLGDSLILLGRWNGFTSQVRLAFDIADPKGLPDTLAAEGSLRLSLGFPFLPRSLDRFKEMVAGPDSLRFLVESWAFPFSSTSDSDKEVRADSLRAFNNHFLVRRDTSLLLDSRFLQRDTVTLAVKTLYEKEGGQRDSLQVRPLPNLRTAIRKETGEMPWIILLQITEAPHDTGAAGAMLRMGGNHGGIYSPALLLGGSEKAKTVLTAEKTQKFNPLVVSPQTRRAVNSHYRFAGSDTSILSGKTRGLHFRLDRAILLDSIGKALERNSLGFRSRPSGDYDLGYFVPFARISFPIDTSLIEGRFPLDLRLSSDLDSLLPDADSSAMVLPLGKDSNLVRMFERHDPARTVDSVSARYDSVAQSAVLRRFILWSGKDSLNRDTTYLKVGETREVLRTQGSNRAKILTFKVKAEPSLAAVRIHINAQNGTEEEFVFKDPETGVLLSDLSNRIPKFLTPATKSLELRATRGFQRLLNRRRIGQDLENDFLLQPVGRAAVDTATKQPITHPTLGEIRPGLRSGRLGVDILLYLYPLKDR